MGVDEGDESDEFEKVAEEVKNLKTRPTDEELLELYGLYKQANVGDCNTSKPGMFDPKGQAKWHSWNGKKGISKGTAKENYIVEAKKLIEKYGQQ